MSEQSSDWRNDLSESIARLQARAKAEERAEIVELIRDYAKGPPFPVTDNDAEYVDGVCRAMAGLAEEIEARGET